MTYSKDHVAECLIANRTRRRMSREALAETSGIPVSTIQSYEEAKNGISFKNAWTLADVFDLDLDALFERKRKAG